MFGARFESTSHFAPHRAVQSGDGIFVQSPEMKVRDVLRMLKGDGWLVVVTEGSHRQLKHPTKSGRVTVSGHPSLDVPRGTLNSILKQAGLK